jgi:hypothetical protein
MNTKLAHKFLYAPALFTALALTISSVHPAGGAEARDERLPGRATVFRETQKIKDGPVMAEHQIAVAKGEMALSTRIVDATACAQWQDRDDDYLNIYWKDGRGFEWKPGASEGILYPCDERQMANYLLFWINRGGLYNYPLRYFPADQPDGTYNLDLPDNDPLKEDYPNVKVTVVAGQAWVSEATLISRKMPNQPIVIERALPNVIDDFQIPPLPNSIHFKPAENPLAQRMRSHE